MTNKIEIVDSITNGEDFDFVVCLRVTKPLIFADNLVAHCCKCHMMVQFRPHAPKTPPRICQQCVNPNMQKQFNAGELHIPITENTAADLRAYFRKRQSH